MTEATTTPTGADRALAHNAAEAQRAVERRAQRAVEREAALKERYSNILSVTAYGPNGPTRVEIACDDPQTRQGVAICEGAREIAVQDLFQVHRCEACQSYIVRKARRARQAERDKALRAAAKAAKA